MTQVLQKPYKIFGPDRYAMSMSELTSQGFEPQNLKFPMNAVIEVSDIDNAAKKAEWLGKGNYFGSIDGVAYPQKGSEFSGEFTMVWNSELLKGLPSNADIFGAIDFPLNSNEAYTELTGPRFKRAFAGRQEFAVLAEKFEGVASDFTYDVQRSLFVPKTKPDDIDYWSKPLYEINATPTGRGRLLGLVTVDGREINEVENSDVWLSLAHGDPRNDLGDEVNLAAIALRRSFWESMSRETERYGLNGVMAVNLSPQERDPTLRVWYLLLDTGSVASGDNDIGRGKARLVGVR